MIRSSSEYFLDDFFPINLLNFNGEIPVEGLFTEIFEFVNFSPFLILLIATIDFLTTFLFFNSLSVGFFFIDTLCYINISYVAYHLF